MKCHLDKESPDRLPLKIGKIQGTSCIHLVTNGIFFVESYFSEVVMGGELL